MKEQQSSIELVAELQERLHKKKASPESTSSALSEQRNALAEARLRIIARKEHVETWLKQSATEETLTNWAGIVEGLRQARQIIGAMWDELPVPKPQAVIDHEAHMRRVIEEQNTKLGN